MNVLLVETTSEAVVRDLERVLGDVATVTEVQRCATLTEAVQRVVMGGIDAVLLAEREPGAAVRLAERLRGCGLVLPILGLRAAGAPVPVPPDVSLTLLEPAPTAPAALTAALAALAPPAPPPVAIGPPARDRWWFGRGPAMQRVLERVRRAARAQASVLVTGETGTGKELVAQMLHAFGPRAPQPFVAQNCAALPDTLLESELFGYRRGAFTGALQDQAGLVEAADGGTLFLDEVADMAPSTQAKLLRVVENREVRRLGEARERAVDVRFVAATNVDLRAEVAAGRFRRDLFYRLSVVPVELPPLRERPEDIVPLVQHFARRAGSGPVRLSERVVRRQVAHAWPGNVRELRNVVEAALVLGDGTGLGEAQVGELLADHAPDAPGASTLDGQTGELTRVRGELERLSKTRVVAALAEAHGNKSRAARACGCSRGAFYYTLRKYNLMSA